jgi:GNAT superfamily N-acetyltransferase
MDALADNFTRPDADGVTVQTENLIRGASELQPFLEAHFKELALFQESVPLAINWPWYYQLAASNQLLYVTARGRDRRLLGYYVALVTPCPHYFTTPKALHDVMRVLPEARGSGIGLKLMLHVEQELRAAGVKLWYHGRKAVTETAPAMDKLVAKLGFRPADLMFAKLLD